MLYENELFRQIRNSEEKAFELIFRLYYKPLKQYAQNLLLNEHLCEDIVHEVFINIWQNRKELKITSPRNYLYTMVKNKALNQLRHDIVKQKYIEEVNNTSSDFILDEDSNCYEISKILETIYSLPEQCKKIFIMSRMHGLKHAEIAEDLNISVKTVKNQIGKALKRLREEFKGVSMGLIIIVLQFFVEKY